MPPRMVRMQLMVAFLLLGLQLGMHGAQARRDPHTDHDLVPGRCLEAAVAGGSSLTVPLLLFLAGQSGRVAASASLRFCYCVQVG